jgi:hypothetical protein
MNDRPFIVPEEVIEEAREVARRRMNAQIPHLTLQCPCGVYSFIMKQNPHNGEFDVLCNSCGSRVAMIKGYSIEFSKGEGEEETNAHPTR